MDDDQMPYRKRASKTTPVKADHAHEYIRVETTAPLRYWPGGPVHMTTLMLRDTCAVCGHKSRKRRKDAVTVEVTYREYRRLKEN